MPATARAAVTVVSMMSRSLCLTGRLRYRIKTLIIKAFLMPGRIRQTQQYGADSKIGSLGGFRDDFNVDAGVYYLELNDAAPRREVVRIAPRDIPGEGRADAV